MNRINKASMNPPSYKDNQQGATLIVVLVILVAMTFLGLGSMSDTNLQLAMVRNSQLQTAAYTTALTEINSQIDAINTNAETDVDTEILTLVQTATTVTNGVSSRTTNPTQLLPSSTGFSSGSYTRTLSLTEPNADAFLPVTGMSLSPDSTVKWLIMRFDSTASISGARSDQTQGFRYLSAN